MSFCAAHVCFWPLADITSLRAALRPSQPSNMSRRCRRRSPNVFRNNGPFWARPGCENAPEKSGRAENRYGDGDDDCPDNDSSKEELVFRSGEPHLALFGSEPAATARLTERFRQSTFSVCLGRRSETTSCRAGRYRHHRADAKQSRLGVNHQYSPPD
jgi:hypothetical protein